MRMFSDVRRSSRNNACATFSALQNAVMASQGVTLHEKKTASCLLRQRTFDHTPRLSSQLSGKGTYLDTSEVIRLTFVYSVDLGALVLAIRVLDRRRECWRAAHGTNGHVSLLAL